MDPAQFVLIAYLFARALVAWGLPEDAVTLASVAPVETGAYGNPPTTVAAAEPRDDGCHVIIYPEFWVMTPASVGYEAANLDLDELRLRLIEHEAGHCLGFGHEPGYTHSVMVYWPYGVTDEDRATEAAK